MPRNLETDDVREMATYLSDALPDTMCLRTAVVALSMVTATVIEQARPSDRDELTELFCSILRKSTRTSH